MDHHLQMRLLVLGAHPDDAEFHAGGLLLEHARLGNHIRIVSVTDGRSGHQTMDSTMLVRTRREEANLVAAKLQCEYEIWDFPDGSLMPDLNLRHRIIQEVRTYQPDLVLTHRLCDYHPDHRAVGQAVQDASYLMTCPKVVPEVPALRRDPVVAYMPDLFTRPNQLRPDAVLNATSMIESIIELLECHASQFYDWIPYNQCLEVPTALEERRNWLRSWYLQVTALRTERFWNTAWGPMPRLTEAYEISEYAGQLDRGKFSQLFPKCRSVKFG